MLSLSKYEDAGHRDASAALIFRDNATHPGFDQVERAFKISRRHNRGRARP